MYLSQIKRHAHRSELKIDKIYRLSTKAIKYIQLDMLRLVTWKKEEIIILLISHTNRGLQSIHIVALTLLRNSSAHILALELTQSFISEISLSISSMK
jgi:hypothetical protein